MAERTFKPRECSVQKYPKLNHFFTEGDGELSLPSEYEIPANVPEYVIRDIITWVNDTKKKHQKPSCNHHCMKAFETGDSEIAIIMHQNENYIFLRTK